MSPLPGIAGPHLDQAARDLLDDIGLVYSGDGIGSGEAVAVEAVTAS